MTPTIVYAPTQDEWFYHRDEVTTRAVQTAAAAKVPVQLVLPGGTSVIVQPTHFEQLRIELNALLPQCERQ